jgi:GTP cyclohydrolase II
LVARAEALAPVVRGRALETEQLRCLPDATMVDIERAGFFEALVPKRWGGMGLGLEALCGVARAIAHGDGSTAWALAFMMEHNWMACHLGMEVQEQLYAERPCIKAAAPLQPGGTAVGVDGGYLLTGKFSYASGVMNSEWTFATAFVGEGEAKTQRIFLVRVADVTLHDDWHFSGMCGTGSASFSTQSLFVPEGYSILTADFFSADSHPGAEHAESLYRYPIMQGLLAMMAAIALGCGEAVVEIGREKLGTSAPWGRKRLDRELSRQRWLKAHQIVRTARLVYDALLAKVIEMGETRQVWSLEDLAQLEMDIGAVGHLCKDAARLVADGSGSSAYNLREPLQRYLRDLQVLANHLGMDEDVVGERSSRWLLGLGLGESDPGLHKALKLNTEKATAS